MKRPFTLLLLPILAAALHAHPMGNFSVSHYANLQPGSNGVQLHYALDLAEIPTFDLLRQWQLERTSPQAKLQGRANEQAREWLNNLSVFVSGKPVHPRFESAQFTLADGAGNLPILRIAILAHVPASGGTLEYEDHNYPERTGWKEIVVSSAAGANLVKASQSSKELSHALTQYPPDPTIAPPQDLRAKLQWTVAKPQIAIKPDVTAAKIAKIPQPNLTPVAPAPATLTAQAAPAGSVARGDFLSKLLHQRELSLWTMLVALGAAFVLGAAHALTPGHGKSIVAAYLVGSRGTLKHAVFLGAMVTFTHTVSVFALGVATLFLFRYFVPEKITQALGVISGLSIVVMGAWMLSKRLHGARSHSHHHHDHGHDHEPAHVHAEAHLHAGANEHVHAHAGSHSHDHGYSHDHGHSHDHPHTHDHSYNHDHGHHQGNGHSHSHLPTELSWKGLIALGASGGLVPCESALVLLLGATALGKVAFGLLLLLSFSLGLALVLMLIGMAVLYAKNLIPERNRASGTGFFRWVSIASPAIVMTVGILMTAVSLGWIQARWMVG